MTEKKDPHDVGVRGLLKALPQITGSEEVGYRAAGAVLAWIAYEAELAAREGRPYAAIEELGERLNKAIGG